MNQKGLWGWEILISLLAAGGACLFWQAEPLSGTKRQSKNTCAAANQPESVLLVLVLKSKDRAEVEG